MTNKHDGLYGGYIKRVIDIIVAVFALFFFCWLYAIIYILTRMKLGKPVFFGQVRIGKGEKTFKLYKFRSMTNGCDETGKLLPDAQRLTKFGRILRATSLDEIPSVWNILKGDISVVGPRPLPVVYLPFFLSDERLRHCVRPGMTGLAQINGRNAISWDDKFKYDINYVKNISFWLDVKIFFMTILKVLSRNNIGQGENMPVSLHIERANRIAIRHGEDD